jgi:hypothetical protein
VACSACTPFTYSATDSVQPFAVGNFSLSGFPATATSSLSGFGAQVYGSPNASLSGSISTGTTFSAYVAGESLSIASGTQNGTSATGSVNVSSTAMFDTTFQLSTPYDLSLSGQTYLSSGAIEGSAISYLELVSTSSSTPLMLYQTTVPGEFDNWQFNQILSAGTYQLEGYAYAQSDGTFPPDYSASNNQSNFDMSVSINPIPLPDTLWLTLSGLAGFATLMRMNRRVQKQFIVNAAAWESGLQSAESCDIGLLSVLRCGC